MTPRALSRWIRSVRVHNRPLMKSLNSLTFGLAIMAAVATLVLLIVRVGFDHAPQDNILIRQCLRWAQGLFALRMLSCLITDIRGERSGGVLRWVVDGALVLTLIAWIYPRPVNPWIPWLATLLYSRVFLYITLGVYAVMELCYGLMRVLDRRTNPSLILAASFLFFIVLGSILLMLPKCTVTHISYTDSLFTATSAVCIAGLCPVDVPTTLTPLGLGILAALIQIGGLGVLTFTSFFAIFFSGRASVFNQLLIRDFIYSRSMSRLVPTLMYVLAFTLAIEAIGAVLIYITIPDGLLPDTGSKVVFASFHALSAFCNAGFSNLPDGMANPTLMGGSQNIYLVLSLLIFAGGIGFPNLVNFKDVMTAYLRRLKGWVTRTPSGPRSVHIYDLNTKLVLTTTIILTVVGALLFFILEYNNTLHGMSLHDKAVQALFNSLTPRSAGFVSVGPGRFLNTTLLVVVLLMWIGGASQSLAGGIKVNTFAALALNLRSIILGYSGIPVFRRNLAVPSVRRANAVVFLSILTLAVYTFILLALEPHLPTRAVVFETISALFTVGSSMGITPELGTAAKLVLCTAMFLGRVGVISLISGLAGTHRDLSIHYPSDNIIIN